jgi:hypothetical protein
LDTQANVYGKLKLFLRKDRREIANQEFKTQGIEVGNDVRRFAEARQEKRSPILVQIYLGFVLQSIWL